MPGIAGNGNSQSGKPVLNPPSSGSPRRAATTPPAPGQVSVGLEINRIESELDRLRGQLDERRARIASFNGESSDGVAPASPSNTGVRHPSNLKGTPPNTVDKLVARIQNKKGQVPLQQVDLSPKNGPVRMASDAVSVRAESVPSPRADPIGDEAGGFMLPRQDYRLGSNAAYNTPGSLARNYSDGDLCSGNVHGLPVSALPPAVFVKNSGKKSPTSKMNKLQADLKITDELINNRILKLEKQVRDYNFDSMNTNPDHLYGLTHTPSSHHRCKSCGYTLTEEEKSRRRCDVTRVEAPGPAPHHSLLVGHVTNQVLSNASEGHLTKEHSDEVTRHILDRAEAAQKSAVATTKAAENAIGNGTAPIIKAQAIPKVDVRTHDQFVTQFDLN